MHFENLKYVHYMNTIQCVSRDTDRLACLKSALHHFSNISAPLSRHTDSGAKSKTKLNSEATRKQLLDITEELSTKLEEAKLDQEQEETENVCIIMYWLLVRVFSST